MQQEKVIAFLSNPASYGLTSKNVERHETHGAIVFLAGEYAYKLKRAVRYSYMDYSTPDRRHAACDAEVAVNRRTAPELYLEIRGIVPDADGTLRFSQADDPHAVDWVVVMRRFPQDALLEQMRRHGALTDAVMRELAETIAQFHAQAETTHQFGGASGIKEVVEENIAVFDSIGDALFPPAKLTAYATAARSAVAAQSEYLDARRDAGFVRHCHGDLHLNNVCMIDGKPLLFDAIEFSDAFSHIDVFYDLAFLLMDLEHAGERAFANVVLNRYLECAGDYGGLAPLQLFLSCRAAVRAHVRAVQAAHDQEAAGDALSYLDDTLRYLGPNSPQLLVLGGISGTGKSTLGRALAPRIGASPGAVILRSDVLRKSLWGMAEDIGLPQAAYAADVTQTVYELMSKRAAEILSAGHSVIMDAVYGIEDERRSAAETAERAQALFLPIWLHAPMATLERRVATRRHDASDATVDVLRRQHLSIVPPAGWMQVDAGGTPQDTLRGALAALEKIS